MDKNQKSLRWHRRRAYAKISVAHAEQALKSGNNNEFVTAMHKANRDDGWYCVAKSNKALFLIETREQRKNEKNT